MQTTVSMNLSRVRYTLDTLKVSLAVTFMLSLVGAAGTWPEMEDMSEYVRRSQ